MRPLDIESRIPIPKEIVLFAPVNIITTAFLVCYLLSGILFMKIITFNMNMSLLGNSNALEFLFMLLIVLIKYSQLAVQIYGIFFDSKRKSRNILTIVSLLLIVSNGVLLVVWNIKLMVNSGTFARVVTDPIILYLLLGGVMPLPGLISFYFYE
jgi:hypothetical protein